LSRSLPSVLAQTYSNIEVIIAAHGCTDETKGRVEVYCETRDDPRVRVIDVPRRRTYPPTAENHWLAGPVVPANAALHECQGEWIARNDDDDCWTSDHLEVLLNAAQRRDCEFVSAAHVTVDGRVEPYCLGNTEIGGTQTWLYRSYLKMFRYNPDCWRKRWNRVNDTDLQDRMWRAGVRMAYTDQVVAYITPRPGESEIGLQAYLADQESAEQKFKF
jgi:glycosyltransferase involved in cell wall biosynthesis